MAQQPWISVIIDNYNYGAFLSQAIESALAQTYPKTEVIVVDDGSTDDSRQIITKYNDQIVAVFKENGGQASAFNAGFHRSRGEVIVFLDADDLLLSDTAERIAETFQSDPHIARIQYRLAVIDHAGAPTGTVVPPTYIRMPDGDLRRNISQLNNCAAWWPTTSGHAFTSWTLRKILPMPEPAFRLCADYYLLRASALCGPIVSLDRVGGYYRFHGSNNFHDVTINLEQNRRRLELTRDAHLFLKKFAESLGLEGYARDVTDLRDVVFLAQRMVSIKLDATHHPIQEDSCFSVFCYGAIAAVNRANASPAMKLLYLLWFMAMLAAPRPIARFLAEKFFHPETRQGFSKLLGALQSERACSVNAS